MGLTLLFIALGGSLGAVSRYQLTVLISKLEGIHFPYATLIVNVVGSFLIGAITATLNHHVLVASIWHPLIVVGFLGALTTFSTFSLDNFLLLSKKRGWISLLNIASNLTLGLSAVTLGYFLFT